MSKELITNWDPYKYISKSDRDKITSEQFNKDFEEAKDKTKKEIEQLNNEHLNKLNEEENKRYKENQISSIIEFYNIKNNWSKNMYSIIRKIVSNDYNLTDVELIYLIITFIIMIIIYYCIYSLYTFIKYDNKVTDNNYKIILSIDK